MRITVNDARELGYCSRGMRNWFKRNGLDWSRFVRDGLPAEVLIATGDAMAVELVEHVRGRNGRQQRQ